LKDKGIKPIFGSELYHGVKPKGFSNWTRNERDQAHFVAGAMTSEGLKNLWRLVDSASKNFRYVGRVHWDDLERYSEGLFATSACIQGLVPQGLENGDLTALDKYLEIYKDNFFIELHTYPGSDQEKLNLMLAQVAQERGIPVVYANDAHFAFPNQYPVHDAYVAMQTGESVDTPIQDRKMWHPMALYMMDEFEIRDALHYLPASLVDEALRNTVEIAERCDVELPAVSRHLPAFIPSECPYLEVEEEESAAKLFIDLVEAGIHERYGDNPDQSIWDRAEKEMTVFLEGGLEHYFLQAWDFCQFCDQEEITRGPGRGSAAGALVSYALGITDVDPIRYKLSFERFYNPGRAKGFPDIDNDFPQGDRKKIKEYLAKRWGSNNVRSIGTVTRMKPKAALDKTYNAMGVTFLEKEQVKKIVATVPDIEILGSDSIGWKDDGSGKKIYVWDHVGGHIQRWIDQQPQDRRTILSRWMNFLEVVTSRVSGYGVHASGVVVSDIPLDAELPSMWSASQECQATVFPMTEVETRQFVKQDILGLRTLDTLQDWHRQVKEGQGVNVKWSGLEAKDHPVEMWEMLDRGLATGIFQIEDKSFVRQLAIDFKPRSVEDLSIIVALNRPGPIRSGTVDRFVARRRGDEPVDYDHPFLESILEDTYGLFIYQEQVISLFSKMGYSESDADAVRKILGKKKPEDMKALRNGKGEWKGKGYSDIAPNFLGSSSDAIWSKLEEFALYSFNKSHSLCYATIAFRTLYAKYYAPAEFIMACIRTNPDDAGLYVAEGRRLGITVRPPDIRKSEVDVAVKDDAIYFGLSNVKGVKNAAAYIKELAERHNVWSLEDFQQALALESEDWTARKKAHKESGNPAQFKEPSPKMRCKSNLIEALNRVGAFDAYVERSVSMSVIQEAEKELLGIILTDNSDEAFANNQDLVDECDEYQWFQDSVSATAARLPGTIVNIRPVKTKAAGKDMGIIKIEWGSETIEFAVFPQQWMAYKFLWKERTPGIFMLKKTDRGIHFEDGMKLS
jgi:DNA polymerase-3 subunit alpha